MEFAKLVEQATKAKTCLSSEEPRALVGIQNVDLLSEMFEISVMQRFHQDPEATRLVLETFQPPHDPRGLTLSADERGANALAFEIAFRAAQCRVQSVSPIPTKEILDLVR